ncbi:beta-galactosidase GalA [Capsulimonas corticalis]|nr:beta-galactosidase GalA [Capsulimonas corticalis]
MHSSWRCRSAQQSPLLLLTVTIAGAMGMAIPTAAQQNGGRQRLSLDAGWRFRAIPVAALDQTTSISDWTWTPASDNEIGDVSKLDESKHPWQPATLGQDVFHNQPGYAWFRTTLPALTGKGRTLHFRGVDDNAVVFLNGKRLASHEGWDEPFDVSLDSAWDSASPNNVLVLVRNTGGGGYIWDGVTLGKYRAAQTDGDLSQPRYDDSHWRTVNVPHDYVIEQPFTEKIDPQHASLPTPSAWYRKTIVIPNKDRNRDYWLDFDGIYRDPQIYVNGKRVGGRRSGYLPIHIDLSSLAKPGERLTIAVHVDPSKFEGWWYEGGGIYRHAWLTSVDRLHIEPDGVWVAPKAVGSEANPDSATVETSVALKNSGAGSQVYTVVERVLSPGGKMVASLRTNSSEPIGAGARAISKVRIPLPHPLLWSLETPNLYKLETSLEIAGHQVDRVVTTFGVRTVRFDPNKGFFLNGKSIKIKGVCNHQDFAGIGVALPDNLQSWRVKKMQAMGANAWRMSHNPPNNELLDACDRLGVLVLDENRHLGDTYVPHTYAENTTADDLTDLDDMIVRDRNHPSIFAWSLCNEEPLQGTDTGAELFKKMIAHVRRLDPSRLVTCAMNASWGKGVSLVEDIQGCNYLNESFENFHKAFPNQPMLFTESSSAVSDRGVYENDSARGYVGNYTDFSLEWLNWVRRTEDAWKPIAENDYLSGAFVWTGFDYKGEPSPYGWPNISSHFGILDMCGFPKDVYYYYKANWGDAPVVHITPHWTWPGREGKPISVIVFSNEPTVDLSLNGVSLGRKACPRNGHAEWSVVYGPGTLTAKAYDARGQLAATDETVTAGKPYKIVLRTDLTKLSANGEDESVIEAAIVDENGKFVPLASTKLEFTISGDAGLIAGTGNGDPNDHTPDASNERSAFHGRAVAIIRSTGTRGEVRITAQGADLQPASTTIGFDY